MAGPSLVDEAMSVAPNAVPAQAPGLVPGIPQAVPDPAAVVGAQPQAPAVDVSAVTPDEQGSYDAAMEMASEILYNNEKMSDRFIKSMQEDGQAGAVESIAGTVKLVLNRIEDEFQGELPEAIILGVAEKIAELAMELGEESGAFVLEPQQIDQAKGAVVRDLVETYGLEEADVEALRQGMSEEDIATASQAFGGI